jgi:dihydrofolate reductase
MINIIVAIDKLNGISKNGIIPWDITEDLKRFKNLTVCKKIIMGRKTYESLPRKLYDREYYVITRNQKYNIPNCLGKCLLEKEIKKFISIYEKDIAEEVFCIGGAEIYKLFLPATRKIYITKVKKDFKCDQFFHFERKNFSLFYFEKYKEFDFLEYIKI